MALIAIAADKGAPGVTTSAVALAAVWPRPVLLAECDPAGGDIVYRLPAADGTRLDPKQGLLSLAVAARRGLQPHQVWEHAQKLHGGLDVLAGVTSAEQGAGLEALWDVVGGLLSRIPQADVIADCGRIGRDGPFYDLLAEADAVVLVTRASLAEVVRLRDRAAALTHALQRRGRPGARVGVVVIADHRTFKTAIAEVGHAMGGGRGPAGVIGGLAYEPKSADQLRGQWGGKLDKSLLIRTAREIAAHLAAQLPTAQLPTAQAAASQVPAAAEPSHQQAAARPPGASPGTGRPPRQPRPAANPDVSRPPTSPPSSGATSPESAPPRDSWGSGPHPALPENSGTALAEPGRQVAQPSSPLYAAPVPPPQPLPHDRSAHDRSAQDWSAQGQSAQGQSAQGQSAQGQSAQGQSAQAGPMPRGRHGRPAAPDAGTEPETPDHRAPLSDSPSANVPGGPAVRPGDQGGW